MSDTSSTSCPLCGTPGPVLIRMDPTAPGGSVIYMACCPGPDPWACADCGAPNGGRITDVDAGQNVVVRWDPDVPLGIIHLPGCPAVGRWAWPIPPEHAGPCACRHAPGYEHMTEHTPYGCSAIPHRLTEQLLEQMARADLPGGDVDDELHEAINEEVFEDLEAVAAHRRAAHPELYADLFTEQGPPPMSLPD